MLYGETGAENIVYKDKANVLLVNNTAEFKIRTFKTKISAKSEIIFFKNTFVCQSDPMCRFLAKNWWKDLVTLSL